jgi:hypothetical protein
MLTVPSGPVPSLPLVAMQTPSAYYTPEHFFPGQDTHSPEVSPSWGQPTLPPRWPLLIWSVICNGWRENPQEVTVSAVALNWGWRFFSFGHGPDTQKRALSLWRSWLLSLPPFPHLGNEGVWLVGLFCLLSSVVCPFFRDGWAMCTALGFHSVSQSQCYRGWATPFSVPWLIFQNQGVLCGSFPAMVFAWDIVCDVVSASTNALFISNSLSF